MGMILTHERKRVWAALLAAAMMTTVGAAQRTPAKMAAPATDNEHYVIGADDSLQVTVWREPTISGTFPVRPVGMISLVLIGDLKAAGLTPMQLSENITEKLKKYIQDPSVTVVVAAVNSQRLYVIGEVNKVGPVMITPGMTPLQAVSAAGGLTPFANSKHIYILRGQPGKQQKIPFNYKAALKGDNKQLISLQPGDTIVVP
jgi:polysaccharide export outer membrane protein